MSVKISSALAATHSGKIDIADADSKPLVYPNPAHYECTVVFNAAGKGKYTLEIADMNGKKVVIKSGEAFAGENKVKMDISQLANGIYVINLIDDEHGRRVLKLNKQ